MPLTEPIRDGLREVLNRFGKRVAAFERAEDLRHLFFGSLEERLPVALAQSARCPLTLRRNFARFVKQLLNTPGSYMQVLGDPFRPTGSSGHWNPSPRLCPASTRLPQVGDSHQQIADLLGCSRWLVYTVAVEFNIRRPRGAGTPARCKSANRGI